MTIAIDARIINSSTGRYIERLLHYLQDIDTATTYIVLVRQKDVDYWQPRNKNFTVQVADFDNFSFAEQVGFKRFLDQLQPDLVHFCMPQQPILYTGKTVTTFHDLTLLNTYNSDKNWLIFHAKQLIGHFVFKRIAQKSNLILAPSEYTRQSLIKFATIPANKVHLTYEAAEHTPTTPEPYNLPFKRFIMYVGQQPDYKNIRRLGDAHQKLLQKHPDLGLVLVGKKAKDAQNNEAYFFKKGYANIHFTGFIPDSQRDWLMQHAEAYVFPSLMEGFGLPGLEAMAAGAPVVSSNATCLPEVYGDAAHYRAIDEVISNDELRAQLITRGSAKVKEYSWKRMAEQTHTAYMEALGTTSSSAQ
jgi:glycosyltransferase involved in cell wall biosynthesis